MGERRAELERITRETQVRVRLDVDGGARAEVDTGIAFLDHMLTLMAVHGFLDLALSARGDLAVDFHHTVEDVGLVLGEALDRCLGDRKGIQRFGHAVTPMDDALAQVTVDLSKRPFLVVNGLDTGRACGTFDTVLAPEFLRALSTRAGMNLHVNILYGNDPHHILEAVFKSLGRALGEAVRRDDRIDGVRSTKGTIG
jgi:imidazoleglycerol-phosphate dehydratase